MTSEQFEALTALLTISPDQVPVWLSGGFFSALGLDMIAVCMLWLFGWSKKFL